MKKILLGIVFLSCISSVFCTDVEKYSFITKLFKEENIGKEVKYRVDRKLSFTLPSIGYIQYASSFNEKIKYVGKKGGGHIIESTLTEIETNNFVSGGIIITDPFWQAMDGAPCLLYLDPFGTVDYIEPVYKKDHEYLQDAFDAAFNGMFEKNYLYPFGRLAQNISSGDSWMTSVDSSKFYFTIESPASFSWIEDTSTLKKVKDKKRGKIATINNSATISIVVNIRMNILGEERFIKGQADGTVEGKATWDVEGGYMIYYRIFSNLQGDFEMDDETFFTKLTKDESHKFLK